MTKPDIDALLADWQKVRDQRGFNDHARADFWVSGDRLASALKAEREENERLQGQEKAALEILHRRYIGTDLLAILQSNDKNLSDLASEVCRIRGETDANEDLKRFVHYIDHEQHLSRGELSYMIDWAQAQMKRADSAQAETTRLRALLERAGEVAREMRDNVDPVQGAPEDCGCDVCRLFRAARTLSTDIAEALKP